MKRKLNSIFCAITMTAMLAFAASAQTPQAPPKVPPPPAVIGVPPPSPEALRLAAQIAAFATAQCGGKDADAAPDCRIKALWTATQCPDKVTAAPVGDTNTDSHPCKVSDPGFEYEVSSIKLHKDDGHNFMTFNGTADGYRTTNTTMKNLVLNAFSSGLQIQITGAPAWADDLHYDVEAKFVPEVGDALKKLTPDDRNFVRRYMMQQVLKERMNFAAHIDTKEVPSYDLVVGKNGPKLKASDPTAKDNGTMRMMGTDQGKSVITAKGLPISQLARNLSGPTGRPVFDKTGLTGTYDVSLEYVRDQNMSATVPGEGPSVTPADPAGPSLLSAVEEQLGLKLVPSRGPMQVIVIEHMDKPDAN
ncbi:MAG TPA: TIGR03435 family protein [Candidatus Acidoferrales bacterium]|jgi:uncharacterized protein (TIGR03435 family)